MTRVLFSILLIAAVLLIGVTRHGAMAVGSDRMSVLCHHDGTGPGDGASLNPCGSDDAALSGACLAACLGSVANCPELFSATPVTFRAIGRWASTMLILRGRQIGPGDRPPKSI